MKQSRPHDANDQGGDVVTDGRIRRLVNNSPISGFYPGLDQDIGARSEWKGKRKTILQLTTRDIFC